MSATSPDIELSPGQFAFSFSGISQVDAKKLAKFLERAATVANREGALLYVAGIKNGSLIVVLSAARDEVSKNPVALTLAAIPVVPMVVSALLSAMSPENVPTTPLAKAGIELVEEYDVEKIEIVTTEKRFIVMDHEIANEIMTTESRQSVKFKGLKTINIPGLDAIRAQSLPDVPLMLTDGGLTGRVAEFEGELFFSPDGHHFFVPIKFSPGANASELIPGSRARIFGHIVSHKDHPDAIIVNAAIAER